MSRLQGKSILYITEIFHPASGGGEKATYEHLLNLHNEGAEITVITATTHIYLIISEAKGLCPQ